MKSSAPWIPQVGDRVSFDHQEVPETETGILIEIGSRLFVVQSLLDGRAYICTRRQLRQMVQKQKPERNEK
jgi:hypothetical protein